MKQSIQIKGMMCMHCQKHVQTALSALQGVKKVDVDLRSGIATVEGKESVSEVSIRKAVEEAGYQVVSVAEVR